MEHYRLFHVKLSARWRETVFEGNIGTLSPAAAETRYYRV
jgi:hypothetical protein